MSKLRKTNQDVLHFYIAEKQYARLDFSPGYCTIDLNNQNHYQMPIGDVKAFLIEGSSEGVVYEPGHNQAQIESVIESLGIEDGVCVDIGAHNGISHSNTFSFFKKGWSGLLVEGDKKRYANLAHMYRTLPEAKTACHFVTPDNVCSLLNGFDIPQEFDFLSLDIDSYDYFVLDALLKQFRPTLITAEVNEMIPPPLKFTMRYGPECEMNLAQRFYGQSLAQLQTLCEKHDYHIIEMRYMDVLLLDKKYTEGEPESLLEIYKKGFLDLPWPNYYQNYPFDIDALQNASAEDAIDIINKGFSSFKGQYELSL